MAWRNAANTAIRCPGIGEAFGQQCFAGSKAYVISRIDDADGRANPSGAMPPKLSADQRRALNLLAETESCGIPEPILIDEHGFTVDALAGLVSAGYAWVAPGKMQAGGRMIEIARVIVTDAGRRVVSH